MKNWLEPNNKFNLAHSVMLPVSVVFAILQYGLSNWWLHAYLLHFVIFSFGVAFGLHRVLVHQAQCAPWARRLAATIGILSNTGSPLTWLINHNVHHRWADKEGDPTAPHKLGLAVFFGRDRKIQNDELVAVLPKIKQLNRDPYLMGLHRYYYSVQLSFLLLAFLLGGLKGLLFWGLIPTGLSFYSIGALNYFCHTPRGYRNHDTEDESRNVWWLFPLTFGENWHNNHHRNPKAKTNKVRWWEFDLISVYFRLSRPE